MRYSRKLKKEISIWLEEAGRISDLERVRKSIKRYYAWAIFFSAIYLSFLLGLFTFFQAIPHDIFVPTLFLTVLALLISTFTVIWPIIDHFDKIFDELYLEYTFHTKYQEDYQFAIKYNLIDHPNIYALLAGKIIVSMEYIPTTNDFNILLKDPKIKDRLFNYLKFFILALSPILIFFTIYGAFLAFQINILNFLPPPLTLIIAVIVMCVAFVLGVVARDLLNISEFETVFFVGLSVDSRTQRLKIIKTGDPGTNYYPFGEIKFFKFDRIERPILKPQLRLSLFLNNGNGIPIIKCNSNNRSNLELILSRLHDFFEFEIKYR